MRIQKTFVVLCLLALFFSCNDEKAGSEGSRDKKPSDIFADYRITADEGKEAVTCLLQFYEGGPRGATLLLEPPAGVQLDGESLTADSALRTGAFYELQKPLQTFAGKHTITFTDEHGQQYNEEILFEPLVLQTDIGDRVTGDSLVLQVAGLHEGEKLRVLLTDIDFDTPDINQVQAAPGGRLVLTPEDLQQVKSGPVTLMLYKEVERRLQNGPAAGGRLSINYGLSREFELVKGK